MSFFYPEGESPFRCGMGKLPRRVCFQADNCRARIVLGPARLVLGDPGDGGDIWKGDRFVIVTDRNVARELGETIVKISKHFDNIHKKVCSIFGTQVSLETGCA